MAEPLAELRPLLERIAAALERQAPPAPPASELQGADAFVWQAETRHLQPVPKVNRVELVLLKGLERQVDLLLENTRRFARGLPANNALLWGARGMGKSSLVKAVHAAVNRERADGEPRLALVELHREDIVTLPALLAILRAGGRPTVLFCDDLSFESEDSSYKSLKAVLEGGIEGRPDNVIFYASEAGEEKVSLSARFGLWLGFHTCDQDTFFAMIEGYCRHYGLELTEQELRAQAREWSVTRGSRSGRVAWQFVQDLAGRLGKPLA